MPSTMELERLVFRMMGDTSHLINALNTAERALIRTSSQASRMGSTIQGTLLSAGTVATSTALALVGTGLAIGGIASESLKAAAKMETLEVSFRALIGTAEEADTLLKGLTKFALESPFITPQLMEASIELAAFGRQADEILPDLKMIGDVARGNAKRFQEMVYIYGKVIESGRLYQRDINQLAIRGVPVYIELAKMLGLVDENAKKIPMATYTQVRQLVQAGKINSDMVQEIFKKITAPGGLFHGQLEEGMKTLSGLFSNVQEQVFITFVNIGKFIADALDLKSINMQITQLGQQFNNFMKNMSRDTREAIKTVVLLTTAFIGLAAVVTASLFVWNILTGNVLLIIGLITGLIAGTSAWVIKIGGIEEAWLKVKRAASDFWNFIKPILPFFAMALLYINPPLGLVIVGTALLIRYWNEVKRAVEEFYDFIRPTLTALWSLIKVIAFAIRDGLVVVWDMIVAGAGLALTKIKELWLQMGGGEINWQAVKYGMRDFVLFMEYSFTHITAVANLAWESIKYGAIVLADEIMQNILTVPVMIAGAFVVMVDTINKVMEQALIAITSSVSKAVEAIWEAIKTGKTEGVKEKISEVFTGVIFKAVESLNKGIAEIEKRIGKVEVTKIKMGDTDVPIGFKIEGLTKARAEARATVRRAMSDVMQDFQQFKGGKLLQFAFQDAGDQIDAVLRKIIYPIMFGTIFPAADAGKSAGYAYSQAFAAEVKTIDAVLFNSAEATARINTYLGSLRDPAIIDKTRIEVAPMPHEAGTVRIVDVLERIDQHIVDQTGKMELEGRMLPPAGLF